MVIKIKQAVTLEYIETLYTELSDANQKDKVDIKLPAKIIQTDFSLLVSFLQFISTWLRKDNSGNLRLPLINNNEYEDYLNQEFVYPVVVLCWGKSILDDNEKNIKNGLKDLSKKYFVNMENLQLKSKESIPLYCFDHDLGKRGKSRFLYESDKKVVSEAVLDYNLYPIFEKIGNHFNKSLFAKSLKIVIEDFAKITHELFLNTDEHGKTDVNGDNLYPNLRSVYFKFHKRPLKNYIKDYRNNKGLIEYFNSNLNLNSKDELYLFEISVIDSGPGLTKRFTGVNNLSSLTLIEEIEIIKKCLHKHSTSSIGIHSENKGLGLDQVLQTLDGKGFLRIKTGRVDVFRDMRNERYVKAKQPKDILLYDWNENSLEFKQHEEVEGTLISIIYPLGL